MNQKKKTQNNKFQKHVYAMLDVSGIVKIGVSSNMENRIKNIESKEDKKILECYYSKKIDNPYYIESILHLLFVDSQIDKTEWFSCDYINAINSIKNVINIVEESKPNITTNMFDYFNNHFFNGLLSATELVRISNEFMILNDNKPFNFSLWLKNSNSIVFIDSMKNKYKTVIIRTGSGNGNYWVHPFLFIEIARNIHPKIKVEIYEWMLRKDICSEIDQNIKKDLFL